MNHCSPDIPGPFWWTQNHHQQQQQQQQPPFMEPPPKTPSCHHHSAAAATAEFNFNLNNQEDDEELVVGEERENPEDEQFEEIDKEPMFEKPLTPSDVGKLNRLVIPKQHAEKYLPLGGGGGSEKGLLLSFEDESGKLWRFRYSYWNSSQSYVLTKGWSRFVKEKRLDAGDVVLFERHRVDADRLFIGWRRRSADGAVTPPGAVVGSAGGGRGGGWTRVFYSAHSYPSHPPSNNGPHAIPIPIPIPIPITYQPDSLHAGTVVQNQTTPSSGNSKRLRLFGVNLECQTDGSEPSTPDGSSMSSQGQTHCQYCTINNPHASNHHQSDSMDINYYRQG